MTRAKKRTGDLNMSASVYRLLGRRQAPLARLVIHGARAPPISGSGAAERPPPDGPVVEHGAPRRIGAEQGIVRGVVAGSYTATANFSPNVVLIRAGVHRAARGWGAPRTDAE